VLDLSSEIPSDAARAAVAYGAIELRPYPGEQRHASFRVLTTGGKVLWLKVNVSEDLASVHREMSVLESLEDVPSVPRPLECASDGSWLLMSSVDGRQLSTLSGSAKRQALPAIAAWREAFSANAGDLPGFGVPDDDLLGRSCNLAAILEPCLAWWIGEGNSPLQSASLLVEIQVQSPDLGPVHGSFDAGNILVDQRWLAGAVDFEASRPGLPSFDTAALLMSLAESDESMALRWWEVSVLKGQRSEGVFVLGHLILRAWHRHCAGALEGRLFQTVSSMFAKAITTL
jgi:hypothetical protein